jgi:hypothetical protein
MKEAALRLASKCIMAGTTDGFFYPDKGITRAEFVSAVTRAFDMLDTDIEEAGGFTDLDWSDWYYAAAAAAEREGIIHGFEDGTFRGEVDIPKDQMVVAAANTLMRRMNYKAPPDVEAELARY